jgi:CRP-like cAMP-binding protein
MNLAEAIQALQKFITPVHPLPDAVWEQFAAGWQYGEAPRKTLLTASGETEKYLYFITEGVQRAYYVTEDDREATIMFSYPFSFSGVADSFLLQQPSRYHLETLTRSAYIRTSWHQVHELMQTSHAFETLIRKSLSHTLAGVLERQIELQCFSAEQKFRTLLKRSPHVLQLIPHKYLASYLGIDATTFSKLLGTVRL